MVKIKKYGWRIPIFSMYENVVKIKEVRESSGQAKPLPVKSWNSVGTESQEGYFFRGDWRGMRFETEGSRD